MKRQRKHKRRRARGLSSYSRMRHAPTDNTVLFTIFGGLFTLAVGAAVLAKKA